MIPSENKTCKTSEIINKICPLCRNKFGAGAQLMGMDLITPNKATIIVWFHLKCGKKFDKTKTHDVVWDGENFVTKKKVMGAR